MRTSPLARSWATAVIKPCESNLSPSGSVTGGVMAQRSAHFKPPREFGSSRRRLGCPRHVALGDQPPANGGRNPAISTITIRNQTGVCLVRKLHSRELAPRCVLGAAEGVDHGSQ